MENKTTTKKDSKLVFNMGIARALLRAGCIIVDLKPDRTNPDKTIPVFKIDETFEKEFARINKEIAEAKDVQEVQ